MNNINHLIVSSTIDFSTDLICVELEKRGLKYLRINRDCFSNYLISYELNERCMTIQVAEDRYRITPDSLKSVFFRAPVFLRNMQRAYSVQEQLYRSQWSAFIRNLIVFENAKWINNPVSIYKAENKMFQLQVAQQSGLLIPKTFVGNTHPIGINPEVQYIVKSIDTALFYDHEQEMFTYSSMLCGEELMNAELSSAPVMIQECIQNKLDIRVTVIGESLFAVSITREGNLIDGDWRRTEKDHLLYKPIDLPKPISDSIMMLMKSLNLSFGGVDLTFSNGEYRFIEVNPTGEWGWLVSMARLPIDIAITEELTMGVVV